MLKSFWELFSLFKFFLNLARPVLKFCVLVKRSHIIIISSDERIVPVVLCYTIALEGVLSNVLWNTSVRASLSYEWQILVLFFFFCQRELAGKSTIDILQQCKQLLPLPPLSHNVFTVSPVKETPGNPGLNAADKLPAGGGTSSQVFLLYSDLMIRFSQQEIILRFPSAWRWFRTSPCTVYRMKGLSISWYSSVNGSKKNDHRNNNITLLPKSR